MTEVLSRNPWIMGAMFVAVIAEWVWRTRIAGTGYDVRASGASFAVWLGGFLLKPLSLLIIAPVFIWVHALAPVKLPADDWRIWFIGFFAVEFAYYWFHRWSHTINWLWATHATHHSANEMTLPAAIRLGWTGPLSCGWLVYTPLMLIGFPPQMVIVLLTTNLLYQYWLHTEAIGKLGPLEWVLNTPSHHRAHHASDNAYLDCNFGGVLIIFDRMFGSFVAEPETRGLHYGLTDPITSYNPVVIALRQWAVMAKAARRARSLHGLFWVLFGKPADLETESQTIATRQNCRPNATRGPVTITASRH